MTFFCFVCVCVCLCVCLCVCTCISKCEQELPGRCEQGEDEREGGSGVWPHVQQGQTL